MEFQDLIFFDPQEQNFPEMDEDMFWHEPSLSNESLESFNDMGSYYAYEDNNDDGGCAPSDGAFYYDHEGNLLNLSSYEVLGCYYFNENATNATTVPIPEGRFVALGFFVILFVVGIIGNALVISTVFRFGSMRKVTYLYLVNLAAADLLYLLVCLPTLTASYALVEWPFGLLFCRLENYLMSVSMSVSVLTIVATSLDRYLAVLYPVRSRPLRTPKTALVVIGTVWVASLTLLSARIQLFDVVPRYHIVQFTKRCERSGSQSELKIDTSIVFLFLYLLPLIVLALCHFEIGRRLWRSERPGLRLAPAPRDSQGGTFGLRERRRIAKIMIVITVVFAVGWLPVHLYHLVEDFDYGNVLLGEFLDRGTVALFFSFGANSLNPFFYCVFSSTFRKNFKQALLCRRRTHVASMRRTDEVAQNRTPIVLLPRPASILPSSPPERDEFPLAREPLLSGNYIGTKNPSYDLTPAASPLSVEELTGIRVSDSEQPPPPGVIIHALPHSPKTSVSSRGVQELIAVETFTPESKALISDVENFIAGKTPTRDNLKHIPNTLSVTTTTQQTSSSKQETKKKSYVLEDERFCIEKQRNLNAECQNLTSAMSKNKKRVTFPRTDQSQISNTGSFNTSFAKEPISSLRDDQSSKTSMKKWRELVNEINSSLHSQRGHKHLPCPVLQENKHILNVQVKYEGSHVREIYELSPVPGDSASKPSGGILKIHQAQTCANVSTSNPTVGTILQKTSRALVTDVEDVPSFSDLKTPQRRSKSSCHQSHTKVKAKTTTTTHGQRFQLSPVAEMTSSKESTFVRMPEVD